MTILPLFNIASHLISSASVRSLSVPSILLTTENLAISFNLSSLTSNTISAVQTSFSLYSKFIDSFLIVKYEFASF